MYQLKKATSLHVGGRQTELLLQAFQIAKQKALMHRSGLLYYYVARELVPLWHTVHY